MTPEGKVKRAVKRILDSHDVYYFFPATGGYGRAGVPDVICCVNKLFLAIECKAEKGKLTALQMNELRKIAIAGGKTIVATPQTLETLNVLIQSLKGD